VRGVMSRLLEVVLGMTLIAWTGGEVQACKGDSGRVGLCHRLIGPLL